MRDVSEDLGTERDSKCSSVE